MNVIRKILLSVAFAVAIISAATAQPRQGLPAMEIALPSANGEIVKLSSLKGKVVLLDFWASWCGPCRVANKGLLKIYDKFHDKGFEIYSVSLDEAKDDWLKAVKKDKITWIQVMDKGGWETETARQWSISALPTSFLIDREGRLLAMDLQGKELEEALKELIDK